MTLVAPVTGALPIRGPVWPNVAERAAIARSHATTSSLPPPAAAPLTAAMTGRGHERIASNKRNEAAYRPRRAPGVGAPRVDNDPPAQKLRSTPVMTTDRKVFAARRASTI